MNTFIDILACIGVVFLSYIGFTIIYIVLLLLREDCKNSIDHPQSKK